MVSSILSFQPGFPSGFTPRNALASVSGPTSPAGGIGVGALASNPFGSGDPSAPLNNLLGSLPFSSPSPFGNSDPTAPINTILGSLPFSASSPFAGSDPTAPINTILGSLPFSASNPFAGSDPTAPINTILGSLPFSASSPLAGTDASAPLNNLLANLPTAASPGNLASIDPAGLLNMLAGTGISTAANPFTGGLQIPATLPAGVGVNGQPGQIENNPSLQQAIALIQQVPEGANLLQSALSKGYSIRIGDPSDSTEAPGITTEGITHTNGPNGNEIVISPNARDFIKTLVHETYHAATDNDGDSKTEEATANVIGDRVSAIINNRPPRDPQQIFAETFPLYPDLPVNN